MQFGDCLVQERVRMLPEHFREVETHVDELSDDFFFAALYPRKKFSTADEHLEKSAGVMLLIVDGGRGGFDSSEM